MSEHEKARSGNLSLVVNPGVIAGFEKDDVHPETLLRYDRLFESNPDLALWLRRRATQIEPDDLDERGSIAQLALEALDIVDRQIAVNGLQKLFEMPSAPESNLPPAA